MSQSSDVSSERPRRTSSDDFNAFCDIPWIDPICIPQMSTDWDCELYSGVEYSGFVPSASSSSPFFNFELDFDKCDKTSSNKEPTVYPSSVWSFDTTYGQIEHLVIDPLVSPDDPWTGFNTRQLDTARSSSRAPFVDPALMSPWSSCGSSVGFQPYPSRIAGKEARPGSRGRIRSDLRREAQYMRQNAKEDPVIGSSTRSCGAGWKHRAPIFVCTSCPGNFEEKASWKRHEDVGRNKPGMTQHCRSEDCQARHTRSGNVKVLDDHSLSLRRDMQSKLQDISSRWVELKHGEQHLRDGDGQVYSHRQFREHEPFAIIVPDWSSQLSRPSVGLFIKAF